MGGENTYHICEKNLQLLILVSLSCSVFDFLHRPLQMLLAGNCRSPAWAWQLSLVDLGNKFGCWSAENGRSARTENSFDLKSCRKFLLLTFRDLQSWGISFPLSLSMSLPHTYTRRVRRATFVQLSRRGESLQIYLGGAATTNISILIS